MYLNPSTFTELTSRCSIYMNNMLSLCQTQVNYHKRMIPHHILSKMDNYEVEIHGLKMKVTVADDPHLVQQIVSQLNSGDLIGLDIKGGDGYIPQMLVLCSGSRCLIVPNLKNMLSNTTEHITISLLKQFFATPRICFVGFNLQLNSRLRSYSLLEAMLAKKGVEVSEFAARV